MPTTGATQAARKEVATEDEIMILFECQMHQVTFVLSFSFVATELVIRRSCFHAKIALPQVKNCRTQGLPTRTRDNSGRTRTNELKTTLTD